MSRGAGYTRAELLALRSAPACTRLAREYSEIEHVFASPSSNVLISLYGASSSSYSKPPLNSTAHQSNSSGATVQTYPTTLASHALTLLPLVRHGRGLASLNLYPSCQRDLEVNCMLWECCHVGEYNSSKWDLVLGANVFALAIPSRLAVFLRSVSKSQLLECILEVLALIAEDEDEPGLELMRSELEPSIWNLLESRIAPHRVQRPTALLARVETLLRVCHLSPWKVDVYASYVTPSDMKLVLSHSGSHSHAPSPSAGLVRSRATRPVAASFQITATMPIAPVTRSRAPSKNVVYWKLYLDWLQFREMCVQRLHAHPRLVADAMMNAVAQARTKQVWQIAETVLLCAARPPTKANWLAKLPKDVIANVLIPHVLLAACTAARGNHDSWSPEIIPATRRARARQRARR